MDLNGFDASAKNKFLQAMLDFECLMLNCLKLLVLDIS